VGDKVSAQTESDTVNGDPKVQSAFRLGYRFAQLYHKPDRATLDAEPANGLPTHLPSFSELSPGNRAELILREIKHDATSLLTAAGDQSALSTLAEIMRGQQGDDAKKTQILEAFRKLRIEIGADDARLSTAIDLGRMLADTVILAESSGDYRAEFGQYRLQNAYEWLEDLHTSFPENAADAVRGSLQYWEEWVNDAGASGRKADDRYVRGALTRQGERWRRLLSGEILAENLLAADNYRQAASDYLKRTARLTWEFVKRFWWAILAVLFSTGGIIYVIVTYAPGGPAAVAAVIATVVGSLGVSWKTVGSTLGKVAAKAEQPLWNAEVLQAIIFATFIPPVKIKPREYAALRKQAAEKKALPAPPQSARGQSEAPAGANGAPQNGPVASAPPARPAENTSAPAADSAENGRVPATAGRDPASPELDPDPAEKSTQG
jgi:hypothetical protein